MKQRCAAASEHPHTWPDCQSTLTSIPLWLGAGEPRPLPARVARASIGTLDLLNSARSPAIGALCDLAASEGPHNRIVGAASE